MKAIFLDRDGTVNAGIPKYERVDSPDKVEILPKVIEALELLSKQEYANMPLRTSGSIAFPREIVYVPDADQYKMGFMTDWDVPSAHTYLFFSRKELIDEFDKNAK